LFSAHSCSVRYCVADFSAYTHLHKHVYVCIHARTYKYTHTHTHMTRRLRVCSTKCGFVLIKTENTPWHNCRCTGLLLQQTAAHCNKWQHVTTRCNTYPKLCDTIAAAHDCSCNKLQHTATRCNTCNTLPHCNTYPKLHDTICHCNWLLLQQSAAPRQHISTNCNTLTCLCNPKIWEFELQVVILIHNLLHDWTYIWIIYCQYMQRDSHDSFPKFTAHILVPKFKIMICLSPKSKKKHACPPNQNFITYACFRNPTFTTNIFVFKFQYPFKKSLQISVPDGSTLTRRPWMNDSFAIVPQTKLPYFDVRTKLPYFDVAPRNLLWPLWHEPFFCVKWWINKHTRLVPNARFAYFVPAPSSLRWPLWHDP